jgi:hypothetical protein
MDTNCRLVDIVFMSNYFRPFRPTFVWFPHQAFSFEGNIKRRPALIIGQCWSFNNETFDKFLDPFFIWSNSLIFTLNFDRSRKKKLRPLISHVDVSTSKIWWWDLCDYLRKESALSKMAITITFRSVVKSESPTCSVSEKIFRYSTTLAAQRASRVCCVLKFCRTV